MKYFSCVITIQLVAYNTVTRMCVPTFSKLSIEFEQDNIC